MPSQTLRIIDANINRIGEGLRFLEEIARFILNDAILTQQLKTLRHDIVQSVSTHNIQLLSERASANDVGIGQTLTEAKLNLTSQLQANAKRVEESLRVLEELAKLPEAATILNSSRLQKARFTIYTLEQRLVSLLLRQDKRDRISGLYVILDTKALKGRDESQVVQQVIRGGAKVIQLRDKHRSRRDLLPVAEELRKICRQTNVLFIINDYLDLVLATNADGLHLGQEDLPVNIARRELPVDKIIGCSVKTVSQAIAAEKEDADYIAVGAIFPSPTKPKSEVVGLERLKEIKQSVSLPVVAIGGITKDNIAQVIAAGASAVAVVSAILKEENPEEATHQLVAEIEYRG